jgi:hypothetical protein
MTLRWRQAIFLPLLLICQVLATGATPGASMPSRETAARPAPRVPTRAAWGPSPTRTTATRITGRAGRGAPPEIRFREIALKCGTVYPGDIISREFVFSNVGGRTLKIKGVSSNCGCTVGKPARGSLTPGASASIRVKLDPAQYRGRISKKVWVSSNDPRHPTVELVISATVVTEVDVAPAGVYGGRLAVGETAERTVLLRPVSGKPMHVLKVVSSDPAVQVARAGGAPGDEREGAYRLVVHFGPAARPGNINAVVTILTDLSHTKRVTIPAYARVVE